MQDIPRALFIDYFAAIQKSLWHCPPLICKIFFLLVTQLAALCAHLYRFGHFPPVAVLNKPSNLLNCPLGFARTLQII